MNVSKFLRAAVAMSALFIGVAQTAKADIVTWTGDTTGAATVDLSPLGAAATDVPFHALGFTVDTAGEYTFQLTGTFGTDTVLILYQDAFDTSDVEGNILVASDDNVSLNTSALAWDLVDGSTYYIVVSGYDNPDFGAYSLTIGGPGLVSAVPEPSTWLMLAFGLAAVTYAQRRKAQR